MARLAALCLALAAGCAAAQTGRDEIPAGNGISAARFDVPDDSYPHRVLGTIREKRVLTVRDETGREIRLDLREGPEPDHVFEDISPRVVDVSGDGLPEIVVVESDPQLGAQLAVYALSRGELVKLAATPPIGRRFRWLAPAAIADLDGDGAIEIAYVDRPHLARTLRIWRWSPGGLTEIAALPGVTNHRIGDEVIWGGLRDCGAGPEIVLADAEFRQIVSARLEGTRVVSRELGIAATPAGFERALACA